MIKYTLSDNENCYLSNDGETCRRTLEGEAATLAAAKRAARREYSRTCTGRATIVYTENGREVYAEENSYGIAGDWKEIDLF